MAVWSESDVEGIPEGGRLEVGRHDLVTPLARERLQERGISIEVAAARPAPTPPRAPGPLAASSGTTDRARGTRGSGTAATPGSAGSRSRQNGQRNGHRTPSPATPAPTIPEQPGGPVRTMRPPSGALFRRGAPLPAGVARAGAASTNRVVVVGAGHVGMICAMRLVDADRFDEVVLVDIDDGRAAGIALDLQHTAPLGEFGGTLRGVATVEEAGPADYVVITAGRARQPGMTRADLVGTNAEIVGDVARRVALTSPDAVIVVVTNPLDEMTQHAQTASGFPTDRVLGMAGVLDTARFQALVALEGVARAGEIEAIALGSHGDEMVIPLSRARARGRPLTDLVDRRRLEEIVDRARTSGGEVVGLLKSGSAFMAPGMSAAHMVLAMANETGEVMPVAVMADGTYGIRDVYLGLPVRLGRGGLAEIVEVPLERDELAALAEAGRVIRERLSQMAAA